MYVYKDMLNQKELFYPNNGFAKQLLEWGLDINILEIRIKNNLYGILKNIE